MKRIPVNIPHQIPNTDIRVSNQHGYILIVSMLALCLLSLMGIWALSTSDFEYKIASNLQTLESNFNVAEGAVKQQGAAVGFARAGANAWFQIADPQTFNQYLLPPTAASYDPGSDIPVDGSTFPTDPNDYLVLLDYETWPRQNLLGAAGDDEYDYAYLVTYLYPDTRPKVIKGYGAGEFSAYLFRISARQKAFVEIGGVKLGVKAD